MNSKNITDRLFELQDKEYADFQSRLTPGIEAGRFIGVRVPLVRKLAKELFKEPAIYEFLNELPHKYYDEDMLHGLLVSEIKDYEECIKAVVRSEEYYVKMMQAWFFATALAKQWDDTIPYLKDNRLDVWTHNKTIQKARESYRITDEQKEYLNTLKIKKKD